MPATKTDFDPLDVTVHDLDPGKAVSEAADEPLEQDKVLEDDDPTGTVKPSEKEEEEETDDSQADADSAEKTADGAADIDEELAALGFPALDPKLASDPDVAKRYHETQFGIQKVLRQTQEAKAQVVSDLDTLKPYIGYIDALDNPATKVQAAKTLLAELKIDPADLLPETTRAQYQAQVSNDDLPEVWNGQPPQDYQEALSIGLQYPGELAAYRAAVRSMESRLGPELQELRDAKTKAKAETDFNALIEAEAPRVIGYLAKVESGWRVTKEMVREAAKQFPQFKDDLPRAVKAAYPDEFANHKAGAVAKATGKKAPEMVDASSSASRADTAGLPEDPQDWLDVPVEMIHRVGKKTGKI